MALHFCSDYAEALAVLTDLRDEVRQTEMGTGVHLRGGGPSLTRWVRAL